MHATIREASRDSRRLSEERGGKELEKERTFCEIGGEVLAKFLEVGSGDGARVESGVILGGNVSQEGLVRICAVV